LPPESGEEYVCLIRNVPDAPAGNVAQTRRCPHPVRTGPRNGPPGGSLKGRPMATETSTYTSLDHEALTDLQSGIGGQVLTARDLAYDASRTLWNGMIE